MLITLIGAGENCLYSLLSIAQLDGDYCMKKSIQSNKDGAVLFSEDFKAYEKGPFSEGYSAIWEFHYPGKHVFQGLWQEVTSHHSWGKKKNPTYPNWWIAEDAGRRVLKQTCNNLMNRKNWKYPLKKYFFKSKLQLILAIPTIAAGDRFWKDYRMEVDVRPLEKTDLVGVAFRMQDSQRYYFLGFKANKIFLLKREYNQLLPLASRRFPYDCRKYYRLAATVAGDQISCSVDGSIVLEVTDGSFPAGRIGLVGNVPAHYCNVDVRCSPDTGYVSQKEYEAKTHQDNFRSNRFPTMKLWKKIGFKGPCSGKTIRFGDLTGNGRLDILMAQGKSLAPGDNYNAISCLTAMDLEGNFLWQQGVPNSVRRCLNSDLPFQIYDIDGDGANEIICMRDFHIEILDGKTGKIKNRVPTPKLVQSHDKFERIIGDAVFICNLSGGGRPENILIKDRYSTIWAFDKHLNQLWKYQSQREMGHFPFARDINGDGRDEILIGYSLLDADGRKIWELPLRDHADAVGFFKPPRGNRFRVYIAASDEGFIVADTNGRVENHQRLGHMQTVTIARLIPGSPDFQIATNTYWGNPGIIFILDLDGNVLSSFQPSVYGSPLCPVNWLGDGGQLLLLSTAPDETGGLYDGLGNQAVAFPNDGHPLLCYEAIDLNANGIDDLACWDHESMWIYVAEDMSGLKNEMMIKRLPESYNVSNYRANITVVE